ncbi:MAG: hypothetical protein ACYC2U_04505 [Candidatus Amoebophilus sp.]
MITSVHAYMYQSTKLIRTALKIFKITSFILFGFFIPYQMYQLLFVEGIVKTPVIGDIVSHITFIVFVVYVHNLFVQLDKSMSLKK